MKSKRKYQAIIVSGGFDPVHIGHVRMFREAASLGFCVYCGANSDEWLTRKKGKPFMSFEERKEILMEFQSIHEVIAFDDSDDTAVDLIRQIRKRFPNPELVDIAFANGGDRVDGNTPEKEYCEANGIDMLWNIGGGKIQSSSNLIMNSIKNE
jgi:D-beta-D-heptose 7-phosphate kinase/D-beta-D-heptose 1-phosphate adenosyltransferase